MSACCFGQFVSVRLPSTNDLTLFIDLELKQIIRCDSLEDYNARIRTINQIIIAVPSMPSLRRLFEVTRNSNIDLSTRDLIYALFRKQANQLDPLGLFMPILSTDVSEWGLYQRHDLLNKLANVCSYQKEAKLHSTTAMLLLEMDIPRLKGFVMVQDVPWATQLLEKIKTVISNIESVQELLYCIDIVVANCSDGLLGSYAEAEMFSALKAKTETLFPLCSNCVSFH